MRCFDSVYKLENWSNKFSISMGLISLMEYKNGFMNFVQAQLLPVRLNAIFECVNNHLDDINRCSSVFEQTYLFSNSIRLVKEKLDKKRNVTLETIFITIIYYAIYYGSYESFHSLTEFMQICENSIASDRENP